jgi:hypothetical protein
MRLEVGQQLADSVANGIGGSGAGLAQQRFELGEHLFDGIEVGRVFRQEDQARAGFSDGLANRLDLVWLPRLSMMTMSRLPSEPS